jgi:hypothetical protein
VVKKLSRKERGALIDATAKEKIVATTAAVLVPAVKKIKSRAKSVVKKTEIKLAEVTTPTFVKTSKTAAEKHDEAAIAATESPTRVEYKPKETLAPRGDATVVVQEVPQEIPQETPQEILGIHEHHRGEPDGYDNSVNARTSTNTNRDVDIDVSLETRAATKAAHSAAIAVQGGDLRSARTTKSEAADLAEFAELPYLLRYLEFADDIQRDNQVLAVAPVATICHAIARRALFAAAISA